MSNKKPKYIAIAGTIGAGKSTLVDFMCKQFGLQPFFEPNSQNPYLVDFYGDMKRWGFHSQVFFLAHKFRLHQQLEAEREQHTVVQDRTIYEDAEVFAAHLYAQGKLSERDWQTYQDLYRAILGRLTPPDLLVFLRAGDKTLRQRIKLRGRPEEQAIAPAYLRELNKLYEEWFARYDLSETVVIDTSKIDYVSDLVHRLDVMKLIEKHLAR
jgi:deoxyadenosine/deoxycytidine kinase